MCFKKNGVSYSIWMIFIMCNCVVFSFMGMLCARVFTASFPVVGMGFVAAFFALLFLVYILTGIIEKKIGKNRQSRESVKAEGLKKQLILEGILAVVILALGVGIRIYMLPMAGEDAAYFNVTKVSQENAELIVPVQNSVYYYLCLLRGMFLLLGNHWIAGIWLQIGLQVLTSVVLYFVIRKMGGVFAAIAVLGYIMLSPANVSAGLNYSPQMLYMLLWSLGLLFVMLYLNASTKGGEKETVGYSLCMWLTVILVGAAIGFLGYVDVAGTVLVFTLLLLPVVSRETKMKGIWTGRMLLGLISAIGGFFGFIYLDGVLSGASFMRIMNAWLTTYRFEVPDVVALLQSSTPEVMILLIFMAVNIFSFYRRKNTEVITPWIMMTFALAVFYVMGITTESMKNRPLLLTLMCVVAAISVRELFAMNVAVEAETEEEGLQIIELNLKKTDVVSASVNHLAVTAQAAEMSVAEMKRTEKFAAEVPKTEKSVSEVQKPAEVPQTAEKPALEPKKPRFIENPLPLPKKHVKKAMDFAFVPEASQMKYDVEVKDTDDFDI